MFTTRPTNEPRHYADTAAPLLRKRLAARASRAPTVAPVTAQHKVRAGKTAVTVCQQPSGGFSTRSSRVYVSTEAACGKHYHAAAVARAAGHTALSYALAHSVAREADSACTYKVEVSGTGIVWLSDDHAAKTVAVLSATGTDTDDHRCAVVHR